MNLEQKIGAMLCCGWTGSDRDEQTTVNLHAREIVEEMQVGGIILLGRNIADDLAVSAQTFNELQSRSREPLFIIADQEGGMVARFIENVTLFPGNMAIGATGRPEYAYQAAAATADELRAIGVNYNFAPSVDVNNNPDNPIIGTRSYSESPDVVSKYGSQAIKGCQDHGVIACAKHFPGHGDTAVDSHLALPSVPYSRDRLDAIELKPFRAAIAAGVSSIMTTHIMFPALDPHRPATLSPGIIDGLLRNELGYNGVVVTDCMEMKAIADNFGTARAAVMAVEAGVDIVLVCHTLAAQREAREEILKAVKDGHISEDRIDRSVARIQALKRQYRLHERRRSDPSALSRILRSPEHMALRDRIASEAITVVRNQDGVLPLKPSAGSSVLVMGLHASVTSLARAARRHWDSVDALQLQGDAADVLPRAQEAASRADVVIVPTCPNEPWRTPIDQGLQARIVSAVSGLGKPLVVVSVREPYDIRRFPGIPAYVCAYGYREGMPEAAMSVIFGRAEARGRLPVTIPDQSFEPATSEQQGSKQIEEYF